MNMPMTGSTIKTESGASGSRFRSPARDRARPVQRRHRRPGVLLRPAQPLAAGQQREHQRATAPVLPPEHRLQSGYLK